MEVEIGTANGRAAGGEAEEESAPRRRRGGTSYGNEEMQ